jgi:hypothetical protein
MRNSMMPGLVLEVAAMSLFPAIALVFCMLLLFQVPTFAAAVMEAITTFPLLGPALLRRPHGAHDGSVVLGSIGAAVRVPQILRHAHAKWAVG